LRRVGRGGCPALGVAGLLVAGASELAAALIQIAKLILELDIPRGSGHALANPAARQLGVFLIEVCSRSPVGGLRDERTARVIEADSLQIAGCPAEVCTGVVKLYQPE
jgi:hypothetical protein